MQTHCRTRRIVDGVAEHGGREEQRDEVRQAEGAHGRQRAGREEQRVARKEGRHHQALSGATQRALRSGRRRRQRTVSAKTMAKSSA